MGRNKQYVLVNRDLLLERCKFEGETLVAGHVVNGAWNYVNTGSEEQARDGFNNVVTRWPAEPQQVVELPSNFGGNWSEWARKQVGSSNECAKHRSEKVTQNDRQ